MTPCTGEMGLQGQGDHSGQNSQADSPSGRPVLAGSRLTACRRFILQTVPYPPTGVRTELGENPEAGRGECVLSVQETRGSRELAQTLK